MTDRGPVPGLSLGIMADRSPRVPLRPLLALAGGAAAIGFAPLLVRWSETGLNATAFWRLCLALPVLWIWARRENGPVLRPSRQGWLYLAGLCFGLQLCSWHASIAWTSVAKATLLSNLTPVFVVLWYWLALGRRPTSAFLLGTSLALAGAAGLALGGGTASAAGPGRLAGDLLGVITSFWYAAYLLLIERSRDRVSGAQAALVSTAAAAGVAGPAMLLFDDQWWPESATGWAVLAALGVLVQAAGQGSIVWAVGRLPATLSSVVILVQAAVAAALGWIWLGEELAAQDGLYAALILAGILLCRRGTQAG